MKALSGDFGAQAVIPSAPVAGRETCRRKARRALVGRPRRGRRRLSIPKHTANAFATDWTSTCGFAAPFSKDRTRSGGFGETDPTGRLRRQGPKFEEPNSKALGAARPPARGKNGAFGESALGKSQPSLKTALHRITALRLDLVRTLDIASLRVTPSLIAQKRVLD